MYNKTIAERMAQEPSDVLKEKSGTNGVTMHKEVQKSLELLKEYQDKREDWAQKYMEDEQFRAGVQWTKEQVDVLQKRGQSPIVVNRLHPIIETAKALLTFNKPQFRSTGREDSDRKTAKVFSELCQWVWEISKGNEELKRTIDDYYVGGLGYMLVYQDPHADMGKGEVFMRNVFPLDVYVDPNSRDIFFDDAANILISRLMTDEQARKFYSDYMGVIKSAESTELDRYPSTDLKATEGQLFVQETETTPGDEHHQKREYIERYTKVKVIHNHVFEPDSGYEATYDDEEYETYLSSPAFLVTKGETPPIAVTDESGLAELNALVESVGPVFHLQVINPETGETQPVPGQEAESGDMAVPGSTTYLDATTIGVLKEMDKVLVNQVKEDRIKMIVSVGNKLMYTRIMPCENYPIVPLNNIHLRNPYPLSDVRIFKPLQRYINKIRSLIIAHASTSTNVKLLVPRGSVNKREIEEEWGRAGTAVVEFDAELGTPVVAGPVPLPNELYKNEADAKHDLEYGFGVHDLMMGSSANAPSTFRGTVAIDEYGMRRSKSRQADVEAFLKQLFKVAVPLMQQIYTDQKVIRLVQPDGSTTETQFNMPLYDEYTNQEIGKVHDMTVGKYDVVPVAGSTMPSNRWAQLDTYMQMYEKGLIDQVEVLKKTEIVDTEGVLERTSMIQQLQSQLQQAQEEIKNLKGDLQTADRESQHAKKRLEVEKFKSSLAEPKAEIKKSSALYKERLQDQFNNVKESMNQVKPEQSEANA